MNRNRWIGISEGLPRENVDAEVQDAEGHTATLARSFDGLWYDPRTGTVMEFDVIRWRYVDPLPKETHRGNFILEGQPFFVSVVGGIRMVSMESVLWCFSGFDNPKGAHILEYEDIDGKYTRGINTSDFIELCLYYWTEKPDLSESDLAGGILFAFVNRATEEGAPS